MRVYHASNCIVDAPDVLHSRSFLDFGRGFYVTRMKDQAERYGERFMRRGQQAFVKPNDQICLRTQNALDVCLRFIGSEALT